VVAIGVASGALAGHASARAAGVGPADATPPLVTGSPAVGQTLTAFAGTWTGDAPIAFAFQWQDCSAQPACTAIPGATGSTYLVQPSDLGSSLEVSVTAGNDAGTAVAVTSPTAAVTTGAPPAATSQPLLVGAATEGSTLAVDVGVWTGDMPLTFAYQWRRCAEGGVVCIDITGATGQTYRLTANDAAAQLLVLVTATNDVGSSQASSTLSGVVTAPGSSAPAAGTPPVEVGRPTITGSARPGGLLTAAPGSWRSPTPVAFGYQWRRCLEGGLVCDDVPGATGLTYQPTSSDTGAQLQVLVTAGNAAGFAQGVSNLSAVVGPPPGAAPPAPPPSAAPAPAGANPYPPNAFGIDVSYPDCARSRPRVAGFVIVGVNGGVPFSANPCFQREYAWAQAGSPPRAVYLNTAYSPRLLRLVSPACRSRTAGADTLPSIRAAYALGCSEASAAVALAGRTLTARAVIWLDVETANAWSRVSALNAAVISGLLGSLRSLVPQAILGIYSDRHQWQEITNGMSSPATPEWAPQVGGSACTQSFAGGPVWLSQGGGASLDLDHAC
jgi:hypothetical protein